jgi:MFS family permease
MRGLLRGLGPNVVALGFASFFTDFASEMVFPLMPAFLVGVLQAGPAWLGLIEGLANSLSSLLRIVSGWLSDRFRVRKPFIFWGYGIASVARPFYFLVAAAWQVLVIRLVDRLGKGLRLAARDALLADSCDPAVRGKAFGLQHAMDNAGAAIGPLVAFALLTAGFELRTVFLVTAIPGLAVLFVIGGFVKDLPAAETKREPLRLTLAPFDARFRFFLVIIVVFTLGNSSDSFLLLRAQELMVADLKMAPAATLRWLCILWSAHCVVKMLVGIPAGILADRVGRRGAVLAGWSVYALAYLGLAFATSFAPFVALLALYGLWTAFGDSVARAIVADLVPHDVRATAYGMFHFCVGMAALPASLGFGWIYGRFGQAPAFLAGAACAAAACGMMACARSGKFSE